MLLRYRGGINAAILDIETWWADKLSGSSIKTMVIAVLVVINAFFLTFIIIDTAADARSERQAIENACSVLRSNGVSVDPETIKGGGALRMMRASRSDEAESAIARAFLGSANMTDKGVIYLYENTARGTAEFSSGGAFTILLNEGVITNDGGTQKTVSRLLRAMKLETREPVVSGPPGNEIVTAVSTYKGTSVFNCVIEFVFRGNSLESAKGRYMTELEAVDDGAVISTAGTALLCFLAAVKRDEIECARIFSIEAGYRHSIAGSLGDGVIAPAWLVTADSGQYIIDDAAGEIRRLTVEN